MSVSKRYGDTAYAVAYPLKFENRARRFKNGDDRAAPVLQATLHLDRRAQCSSAWMGQLLRVWLPPIYVLEDQLVCASTFDAPRETPQPTWVSPADGEISYYAHFADLGLIYLSRIATNSPRESRMRGNRTSGSTRGGRSPSGKTLSTLLIPW